ncbi:MAG: DUF4163 domain-containing protein [bacterium]
MKKTIVSIIIVAAFVTGLVFLVRINPLVLQPEVTPSLAPSQSVLITQQPEMVSVAEDSYLLEITGGYPQFPQADDMFNKKIADAITAETGEFKKYASEDYQAQLTTDSGDLFQKRFEQGEMYTLSWNTEVIQSNDNYISVIIRQESYTGGAHGSRVARSFNYDVKQHKELILTDLMSYEKASQVSRESFKKVFTENGDREVFESFALEGTDPKIPENFQVFTMTPDVITIYFNEYQVAPYVYGEQQVVIPIK